MPKQPLRAAGSPLASSVNGLAALVSAYLQTQLDELGEGDHAVETGIDRVYPTRVAARRTRSTLRTFGDLFEAAPRRLLDHELRSWAALLGEVRDRSVQIGRLNELAPLVSRDPAGQAAIDFLAQALGHQRDVALEAVRHELTTEHHAHLTSLLGRWRQPPFTEAGDRDAAAVVTYVDAAREHVMEAISRARLPGAADVEVHDARKAGKRYRYAVELATPELGGSAVVTLDRARALQEELGRYQDSVVGVALVSEAGEAAQLPPAVAQGIELLLEALTDAGHKAREAALQLSV